MSVSRTWRPKPFIENPKLRWSITIGALLYMVLALGSVEVNWNRVYEGLDRGLKFVAAFAQPNFSGRWTDISEGLMESLVMTVVSTVIGIVISIPIALGASRNLAPLPIYLFCRSIITVSRTFQEVIIAILFVAIFGFGPF
ncbi:MAG: phosphonate ABC transporter, permease protein PhnE, partial [SAR324 cluster bacterium]|nr:phosphonate ABC transporter, permease protein PhnE [SAR324 cluster bacterium]